MKSNKERERAVIGVAEFANSLGISVHCARNWAYQRKIASTKLGGKLLFIPVSEIDRLIQENLKPAVAGK
jgi:predicted site-specific integrase-resolvase